MAQPGLLVLAVEHDDFHDEILVQTEQRRDLRVLPARRGIQPLPVGAVFPDVRERLVEARKDVLPLLIKLEGGGGQRLAQRLVFARV